MTAKEKILAFRKKYGDGIRKEYMPSVTLSNSTGCNSVTINPQFEEENGNIHYSFYSKIFEPYLLYDNELDVMAVAIGKISSNKTDGGQREWSGNVYYIVDHEKTLLKEDGNVSYCFYGRNIYYVSSGFLSEIYTSTNTTAINQIQQFLGETFRFGTQVFTTGGWCLKEWFTQKDKKKEVDEITKLGTVSNIAISTTDVDKFNGWRLPKKVIIETNDRYDIIRCFTKNKETERVYFDTQTDKIHIFYLVNGGWVKAVAIDKYAEYIIDKSSIDSYFDKTKRLKYFKNLATDNQKKYIIKQYTPNGWINTETEYIKISVFNLIKILRYPILEKLYKAGYNNIYQRIDKSCPKADILQKFGVYNPKAKTIYGILGVNKFQLDFVEKICEEQKDRYYRPSVFNVISTIKKGIQGKPLSDLDSDQFQSLYIFSEKLYNDRYTYNKAFWQDYEQFTHNTSKFIAMANKMNRIAKKHSEQIYRIYNDMITVYGNCIQNRLNVIEINFGELKEYNDFVRIHDYYTNMWNMYQEERRRNYDKAMKERYEKLVKQYEKIYKERKAIYEYTNGDYVFKIPEKPQQELTDEGRILGHCVGGYSDRVLSGGTNIIFLREKSAPTIPFMTIEVNNGKVVQCHGAHNAWLGSCEKYQKAIPTVMNWLHDKGIKCNKNILTSKAMGYSGYGAGNIELPEVPFNTKEILI